MTSGAGSIPGSCTAVRSSHAQSPDTSAALAGAAAQKLVNRSVSGGLRVSRRGLGALAEAGAQVLLEGDDLGAELLGS